MISVMTGATYELIAAIAGLMFATFIVICTGVAEVKLA
jgi:hypothetical protein